MAKPPPLAPRALAGSQCGGKGQDVKERKKVIERKGSPCSPQGEVNSRSSSRAGCGEPYKSDNLQASPTFTRFTPNIWLQVGGRRPERGWALAGGMAQGKGTHLKEAAPGLKSRDPNVAGDSVNAWMAT